MCQRMIAVEKGNLLVAIAQEVYRQRVAVERGKAVDFSVHSTRKQSWCRRNSAQNIVNLNV